MLSCQFITGIFVQHPCKKAALNQCAECGIDICLEHSTPREEGFFCFKCAPTEESESDYDDDIDESVSSSTSFGAWYWYTRTEFYQNSAPGDGNYFDTADYQAFESESVAGEGIETSYGSDDEDFLDS